jgi:hypothetical protein
MTLEDLCTRVRDRYPEAQPLPDRPELDQLLRDAGLELKWSVAESAYMAPQARTFASSSSLHRFDTIIAPKPKSYILAAEVPREMEEAIEFERRLQAAYESPSYLVLATEPRLKYLVLARQNLDKHFPMTVFDCEREFLAALKKEAEAKQIRWEVILRADACKPEGLETDVPQSGNGNGSRDWHNLLKLAAKAARSIAEQVRARKQSMLLIYPGLLGRYGQLQILDELADSLGDHSLWLLAGSERQAASPMVDGQAIPARATQWAWIPAKWIDNEFRKLKGGPSA